MSWNPTKIKPYPVDEPPGPNVYGLTREYFVTLRAPGRKDWVARTNLITNTTPTGRAWAWNIPQVINGLWKVTAWQPAEIPEAYHGEE